ncbi:MAG: hypothetical protein EOO18_00600, partial [Chryseobacterium sp.]
MNLTTKSIFVLASAAFSLAAAQSKTLKQQKGYLASKQNGSIALLSRWNSFKPNSSKSFINPEQKLLSQMGLPGAEERTLSKKNQFYGGQAYKGNNVPYASVTDGSGNTYITGGSSSEEQSSGDFFTIKVGPDGQILWQKREPAAQFAVEYGMHLAFDNLGNIIASGLKWNGKDMDIRVIKYDTNGTKLWEKTYDSGKDGLEVPNSMTTDASGNVYITGITWSGNSVDFLTIKYS